MEENRKEGGYQLGVGRGDRKREEKKSTKKTVPFSLGENQEGCGGINLRIEVQKGGLGRLCARTRKKKKKKKKKTKKRIHNKKQKRREGNTKKETLRKPTWIE